MKTQYKIRNVTWSEHETYLFLTVLYFRLRKTEICKYYKSSALVLIMLYLLYKCISCRTYGGRDEVMGYRRSGRLKKYLKSNLISILLYICNISAEISLIYRSNELAFFGSGF